MSNLLQDAVRAAAPLLLDVFRKHLEANKPQIEQRVNALGDKAVDMVAQTITNLLPANSVAAQAFKPEAQAAIKAVAQQAVDAVGGPGPALTSLAELELDNLAKVLGS